MCAEGYGDGDNKPSASMRAFMVDARLKDEDEEGEEESTKNPRQWHCSCS